MSDELQYLIFHCYWGKKIKIKFANETPIRTEPRRGEFDGLVQQYVLPHGLWLFFLKTIHPTLWLKNQLLDSWVVGTFFRINKHTHKILINHTERGTEKFLWQEEVDHVWQRTKLQNFYHTTATMRTDFGSLARPCGALKTNGIVPTAE